MFSVQQKREISEAVQKILRDTNHPELPEGEIQFLLHVDGATPSSWANILNNEAVPNSTVNPHNERQDLGVDIEDEQLKRKGFADWCKGYKTALRDFAWWKDGIQYVGCGTMTLEEAVEQVDEQAPHNKRQDLGDDIKGVDVGKRLVKIEKKLIEAREALPKGVSGDSFGKINAALILLGELPAYQYQIKKET